MNKKCNRCGKELFPGKHICERGTDMARTTEEAIEIMKRRSAIERRLQPMSELKPCPFCGGESIDLVDHSCGSNVWFIQCDGCGAVFPFFDSREDAVGAWNRRDGK